jgi:transposase-like protein
MMTRSIFTGVKVLDFTQRFKSDSDCLEYISLIKWENGYVCKKCSSTTFCKGKKEFSRRCIKCRYDESATAGTGFEKCKFSILTAFHIAFKLSTKKKGMSTLELSNEFGLRQKTCWDFKWKLQKVMKSSKEWPLKGEVHVDEFLIGGYEQQKRGRSKGKKKLVVLALEKVENGVGRAYAQVIEKASSEEFYPFFNDYISKEAKIITDEWRGYLPLQLEYKNMKQVHSENGKNFLDLHIHIMNLKGWLRGIHHHCSKEQLQGYLDEYHFRYNRRNNLETIFDLLLRRMIKSTPIQLK